MRVKVMFYAKQYERKPENLEIGSIQQNLKPAEIEIEDLAKAMASGATFKPALLNGRKSADFISQQLFALDFDDGTTIQDELERCKKLNVYPVFGYTTFSHKEEGHKFRLVFCADSVISNVDVRNAIQTQLMRLFPHVDPKCVDAGRLFFGGRKLITCEFEHRIHIDSFLAEHMSDSGSAQQKTVPIVKASTHRRNPSEPVNKSILNQKISAICALNADGSRALQGLDKSHTDKEDILSYSISMEKNPAPVTTGTQSLASSEAELFERINRIDLHEYLGIPEGAFVNCILPDHDDRTPSAHIYISDNGTPLYKCFGCNQTRTIIGVTEELAHCKRSKAIEFIKKVYGIQLMESEWVKEQKQIMIDNAHYLETEEFRVQFPGLRSRIRTRKHHLQSMLWYFSAHVADSSRIEDQPVFYASYPALMTVCGIGHDRIKMSKTLALFALLGMLVKVNPETVPEKALKKAQSIAAEYDHIKLTGFYQFPELGCVSLKKGEENAKILKMNHITLAGLSREYVLRTFGESTANKVFPQYSHENRRGTSAKSNSNTSKLVRKITYWIEKHGYMLEPCLNKNPDQREQWKRSVAEVLRKKGWERKRLNNELKSKFGIAAKGYPFIIVPKEQALLERSMHHDKDTDHKSA